MAAGGNSEEAEMDVVGQYGRIDTSLLLLVSGRTMDFQIELGQGQSQPEEHSFTADALAADHEHLSCGEVLIDFRRLGM